MLHKCLKTCLKLNILTPTNTVHKLAKLPLLEHRRDYHLKLMAFKRVQSGTKYTKACQRQTRATQAPILFYHIIHCAAYAKSPQVVSGQIWNELPHEVRCLEVLSEFKAIAKCVLEQSIPTTQILMRIWWISNIYFYKYFFIKLIR